LVESREHRPSALHPALVLLVGLAISAAVAWLVHLDHRRELPDHSLAEVGAARRRLAVLQQFADDARARRLRERGELAERILVIHARAADAHTHEDGRLRLHSDRLAWVRVHRDLGATR
jgi:hypothetical protein